MFSYHGLISSLFVVSCLILCHESMSLVKKKNDGEVSSSSSSFGLTYNRLERGKFVESDWPHAVGTILQSIVDLVKYWRLKSVVIFTPVTNGIGAQELYLERRISDTVIVPLDVDSLRNLHIVDITTFILVDSLNGTFDILEQICETAFDLGLFTKNSSWIIFSRRFIRFRHLPSSLFEAQITLLRYDDKTTKFLRTASSVHSSEVSIYDVFQSKQSRKLHCVEFATWSRERGLVLNEKFTTDDEVALRNRDLFFFSFNHLPYNSVTYKNGGSVTGGYLKEVYDIFFDKGMFRPKYVIIRVNNFGLVVNGSYTGAIGSLMKREVDIALTVMIMIASRYSVVRFSNHGTIYHYLGICIATPKPSFSTESYILPFELRVWSVVVITLFISIVLLGVAAVLNPITTEHRGGKAWKMTFYWIFSGTFIIDVFDETPSLSVKVITRTLLLATMVTFIYYTSLFTSILAYRGDDIPIKTLDDVYKNNEYGALSLPYTRYTDFFKLAHGDVYADIWRTKLSKVKTEDLPADVIQGVQMVRKVKAALLYDLFSIAYEAGGDCSISISNEKYNREYTHITARFDFPYTVMISFQVLRMREKGILDRIKRKNIPNYRELCQKLPTNMISLSVTQVIGLFFVIGFGVAMSIFALLVEMLIWKFRNDCVRFRGHF